MYWKSLKIKVFVATHLDSSPVLRPGQRLSWCPRQYRWRCRPARTKSGPWCHGIRQMATLASPGAPAVPGVQLNWFLPGERPRCTCRTSRNHSSYFKLFHHYEDSWRFMKIHEAWTKIADDIRSAHAAKKLNTGPTPTSTCKNRCCPVGLKGVSGWI